MQRKHTDQLPLPQPRWSQCQMEWKNKTKKKKTKKKHQDKEHGKTLKHEAPRSINHKATENNNNTGVTALEWSVT